MASSNQHISTLPTPAAIVWKSRLERNIERFAAIAADQGTSLRPHIKTHRTLELARLQIQAGASGLATAKLGEAEALAMAGFDDICVVYPLVGQDKAERYAALSRMVARLSTVVDSVAAAKMLVAAAGRVTALLKVDTGLGRCGLEPDRPEAIDEALRIAEIPGLELAGVATHGGFVYSGSPSPRQAMLLERDRLLAFHDQLKQAGLDLPWVSLGSTPTVCFFENDAERRVTELRPGNYVFMDLTEVRLGVAQVAECSLTVLSSVVSVRSDGTAILDAGAKFLSSDRGVHGGLSDATAVHAGLLEEDQRALVPEAGLFRLSEEHGFLNPGAKSLRVGDRVHLLPVHSCPVAHLAGTLHLADDDGQILETWAVMPRGST